ncbi:Crp/Fnr family transcriptional regulator [Kibdelosporangium persicum]|uniref:cAMP-binding protein n=1 Tax=Kibdelosporangium persicum TaxID=2698649 RepID=A0ABX2F7X5_9PSEU|nr:Crp/Fnr family transcriptional regulator [Kibdelosporangium persicum]NRN67464.1 cAMP-binding protein [Kibdelosporangium persicum]
MSWRLSAEGQRKLIAAGTPRRWSAGQVLIRESEMSDHVVLLTGGRVKVSVTAPSGRQVMMAIRGPGDLLGEASAIDGDVRSATVTALTPVEGVSLTNAEFNRFMLAAPTVTVELLKMVVGRLRESTRRRLENGAYDVPARTARLLVDYARDYGEPVRGGLTVKLRQSELAEAAGASREAVAKALKVFRDAGAVRTNRCSFDVLRMDLLDRFAEGIA